jgi:hypothetical protein
MSAALDIRKHSPPLQVRAVPSEVCGDWEHARYPNPTLNALVATSLRGVFTPTSVANLSLLVSVAPASVRRQHGARSWTNSTQG